MKNMPGIRPSRLVQVFFAGCCSVFVGACATPCNNGVCMAEVTVQSCEKGAMTVVPDPITVTEPNNIEWTISTPDYVFTEDGIIIYGKGFTPSPGRTGNGRKYIVHDDYHSDVRQRIKYEVRVTGPGGRACKPFDPFINNS